MSRRRDRTYSIVEGALRSCIDVHGPIHAHHVRSAAKRVVSQLEGAAANGAAVITDGEQAAVIEALRKKLAKLQHGHDRLIDRYERCRAERDALRDNERVRVETGVTHG